MLSVSFLFCLILIFLSSAIFLLLSFSILPFPFFWSLPCACYHLSLLKLPRRLFSDFAFASVALLSALCDCAFLPFDTLFRLFYVLCHLLVCLWHLPAIFSPFLFILIILVCLICPFLLFVWRCFLSGFRHLISIRCLLRTCPSIGFHCLLFFGSDCKERVHLQSN